MLRTNIHFFHPSPHGAHEPGPEKPRHSDERIAPTSPRHAPPARWPNSRPRPFRSPGCFGGSSTTCRVLGSIKVNRKRTINKGWKQTCNQGKHGYKHHSYCLWQHLATFGASNKGRKPPDCLGCDQFGMINSHDEMRHEA